MKVTAVLISLLTIGLFGWTALSAEEPGQGMPPMGPPPQMKDISWLAGEWEVDMKGRYSDTSQEWLDMKGTAKYEFILGGAAVKMTYESSVMGMPFSGVMLQTFDRETNQWQAIWFDNMGARLTLYNGTREDGKTVLLGEERYMGEVLPSRLTTFNETPTSFDWMMESSNDGGKTFWINSTATYKKK